MTSAELVCRRLRADGPDPGGHAGAHRRVRAVGQPPARPRPRADVRPHRHGRGLDAPGGVTIFLSHPPRPRRRHVPHPQGRHGSGHGRRPGPRCRRAGRRHRRRGHRRRRRPRSRCCSACSAPAGGGAAPRGAQGRRRGRAAATKTCIDADVVDDDATPTDARRRAPDEDPLAELEAELAAEAEDDAGARPTSAGDDSTSGNGRAPAPAVTRRRACARRLRYGSGPSSRGASRASGTARAAGARPRRSASPARCATPPSGSRRDRGPGTACRGRRPAAVGARRAARGPGDAPDRRGPAPADERGFRVGR